MVQTLCVYEYYIGLHRMQTTEDTCRMQCMCKPIDGDTVHVIKVKTIINKLAYRH